MAFTPNLCVHSSTQFFNFEPPIPHRNLFKHATPLGFSAVPPPDPYRAYLIPRARIPRLSSFIKQNNKIKHKTYLDFLGFGCECNVSGPHRHCLCSHFYCFWVLVGRNRVFVPLFTDFLSQMCKNGTQTILLSWTLIPLSSDSANLVYFRQKFQS